MALPSEPQLELGSGGYSSNLVFKYSSVHAHMREQCEGLILRKFAAEASVEVPVFDEHRTEAIGMMRIEKCKRDAHTVDHRPPFGVERRVCEDAIPRERRDGPAPSKPPHAQTQGKAAHGRKVGGAELS